jgi:hypothetical protein
VNTEGPPFHNVCAVHIAGLIGRGIGSEKGGRWYGRDDTLSCGDW